MMMIEPERFPEHRAFTLVELMISIALALLLILGVNQIFKYTTQAVGAGQAINADIQASRAAQTTMSTDFGGIVGNGYGPNDAGSIIIGSRSVYTYRNAQDLASEGAISTNAPTSLGLPTAAYIDLDGDGQFGNANVPGEVVWPCTYNFRNHRIDCLSFFSRDTFHRQTGNLGTYVDNMTGTEAWIWYGHLWLPDNNGAFPYTTYPSGGSYVSGQSGPATLPGAMSASVNPNNYFASQFVLGRLAMVLKEKSVDTSGGGSITDNAQFPQRFIDRAKVYPKLTLTPPNNYAVDVDPLGCDSTAAAAAGDSTSWYLENARFDLAATSIASFRTKLMSFINNPNTTTMNSLPLWYDWMMDGNINPPTGRSFKSNGYTRVQCKPFLSKPADAAGMAQASPYLISGCSQFIVEFAGDFLTQDNDPTHVDANGKPSYGTAAPYHTKYGDVIATTPSAVVPPTAAATTPDGQLDFSIVNTGTAASPIWSKQIKWYGMPRSTSGQPYVCCFNGDVVPVRDWLLQAVDLPVGSAPPLADSVNTSLPFEKVGPVYQPKDYSGAYAGAGMSLLEAQNGYICAFGPYDLRPKLIRITMVLEDPNGRLPDGQTYQYVFQVP
jgi:prepilin-type N-terminal cleavage/methylation domain-containing protein